jgi:transposase
LRIAEAQCGSGQPAYAPLMLLKLYLYGYANRFHSSRRLEGETWRNLEVIWLVEELHPSYNNASASMKEVLCC